MKRICMIILIVATSISNCFGQLIINEEPTILDTESGKIYGTLRIPPTNNKSVPIAILIAGSGPTDRNGNQPQMQNNSLKMLSEALFYNGIATLTFDKRGIGESKDSMKSEADLRFEDYINDVKAWIKLLEADKRFSEISIIGHSEGSLIGMIASQNTASVTKYISLAGVAEPAANILKEQLSKQLVTQPKSVQDLIFSYIDKLENDETIEDVPMSLYSLFRPSVQPYMISWFKYDPQTEIKKLTIPILIVQGANDIQVTSQQADLLQNANPKAQKYIIENMTHVLKDCDQTDMISQQAVYTNPTLPLNKELVEIIIDFLKKEK